MSVDSTGFPIRINWLPVSRSATIDVAVAVETCGFEGMGVTDTPRGIEVYTAIEAALTATRRISVGANVTNPVTRHWNVHVAAMRAMAEHGRRGYLGFGTGDSAVRASGGRPATVAALRDCIVRIHDALPDRLPLLVAASGPRAGALAVDVADGVVAGVGTSGTALRNVLGGTLGLAERWATLRIAIGDDVERLRELVRPRAISAARFAFGSTFDAKDVPLEFHEPLRAGFARYDFDAHGLAGHTANADLFVERPDIENYLIDRFAIVDTPRGACERIERLRRDGFTGAYLSIIFEDPVVQIERIAEALHAGDLLS